MMTIPILFFILYSIFIYLLGIQQGKMFNKKLNFKGNENE
jgi:hypothetical protein